MMRTCYMKNGDKEAKYLERLSRLAGYWNASIYEAGQAVREMYYLIYGGNFSGSSEEAKKHMKVIEDFIDEMENFLEDEVTDCAEFLTEARKEERKQRKSDNVETVSEEKKND